MNDRKTVLPFSQACENNKVPILSVIQPLFAKTNTILEVGSGTGQHAEYFSEQMPHLIWQCSDQKVNLANLEARLSNHHADNLPRPIELDLLKNSWPDLTIDAVFSANAVHIMPWQAVEILFNAAGKALPESGQLVLYGPFNYDGKYTSESNANFDQWLKNQHSESAIRDFEALDQLANKAGLALQGDYPLPANNRILHWLKK
jgi:cyclopropane fatty-acyl-phospholipid synthase-like methyltransferase